MVAANMCYTIKMPMWITDMKKRRGFTLIELLVVIAIIGILSTVATVSLVQARRRARDTKRISDIQQVRSALLIYSNQRATYPPAEPAIALGTGSAACLDDSDAGFNVTCSDPTSVIMQRVPSDPGGYAYSKTGTSSYEIKFNLEGEIGNLPGGPCTATQEGVTCP